MKETTGKYRSREQLAVEVHKRSSQALSNERIGKETGVSATTVARIVAREESYDLYEKRVRQKEDKQR